MSAAPAPLAATVLQRGPRNSPFHHQVHPTPSLVLAVVPSKKHRFEQLCLKARRDADAAASSTVASAVSEALIPGAGLEVMPAAREPELIFLRTPTPTQVARTFHHSPLYNRHFDSMYLTQYAEPTLDAVVQRVERLCEEWQRAHNAPNVSATAPAVDAAAPTDATSCVVRVQTYPRTFRAELLDRLLPRVRMDPKNFTHMLFVVHTYNRYLIGFVEKDLYVMPSQRYELMASPTTAADPPATADTNEILSRAYFKMVEAFLIDDALARRITPGCRAIDIGASPGGWSAYLANSHGCHVHAIDPGVVHCTSPLVKHVPKLMENALPDIQSFVSPSAPLDLIVCDMNTRPEVSVALIRLVCSNAAVSPTAALVLTCKETQEGRSKRLVEEASIGLSDYFTDFRTYHLLSNGKERTLIATYLHVDERERERIRVERDAKAAARLVEWEKTLAERRRHEEVGLKPRAKQRTNAKAKDASKPPKELESAAKPETANT